MLLGLHWPRIRVLVLLRKMAFVGRLLKSDKDDQSSWVFRTLACDDIDKISLVDQCKLLESDNGTCYTEQCLNNPDKTDEVLAEAKQFLVQEDWLKMARGHRLLQHIPEPGIVSTWCKIWDLALDHGVYGTQSTQSLFRTMCRPVFDNRQCPSCQDTIEPSSSYLEHICSHHLTNNSPDSIIKLVEDCHPSILQIGKLLSNFQ